MENLKPMSEDDYNKKLQEIEAAYDKAKKSLHIEFAKSHEAYKVGDIIQDNTFTIRIDKITAYKSFGLPEPVYHGFELKKDLTPKKNGDRAAIYGNRQTKLIKSAE